MKHRTWRTLPSAAGLIAVMALSGCAANDYTHLQSSMLDSRQERSDDGQAGVTPPNPIAEREAPVELSPDLPPGAELTISRDGALLTALMNNQGLEVEQFGPRIAGAIIPEERAAFDPTLMAMASYGKSRSRLAGAEEFTFGEGPGGGNGRFLPQIIGPGPLGTASNVLALASEQLAQPPLWERGLPSQRDIAAEAAGFLSERLAPEAPAFLESEERLINATVSTYFPTGTTVFLSGGLDRTETNFVATEYAGDWSVGVNQALLRGRGTDVNLVALRQARNMAARSLYELERYVLGLIEETELAYWDLALAKEVVLIREFAVELAAEQLRLNRDLAEVGEAVQAAVLSAQAEKASRKAEWREAQGELRNATIRLLRLLNAPEDTGWDLVLHPADEAETTNVTVDRQESEQLAMRYRPELRQLELDVKNRNLDAVFARNNLRPELDLFAEYGLTSLGDSLSGGARYLNQTRYYDYTVGLEFSMPLLNRAEKARSRQADLGMSQAQRRLTDESQGVRSEVRQALTDVETRRRQIGASELAVDSREEELRIEQNRYEVGLVTNLDVLQVQRLYIEAQVNAAAARTEYIKALTRLYAREGTLLARRGVQLEDIVDPEDI